MVNITRIILSGLLICTGPTSAAAQSHELQAILERLSAVEASMRSIQQRLDDLTRKPSASPIENVAPFVVDVAGATVMGSPDAKIGIIEYSDFQCPFCGAHAKQAYNEIRQQFVSTGKVKYIFRNFPIEQIHPQALKAAEAAECSGKFWDMRDRLFANQQALAPSDLSAYAQALGVDMLRFQACLTEGQMTTKVRAEQAEARRLGITGTPTFLLGQLESGSTVRVTQKIAGAHPISVFQTAFQAMLATSGDDRKY